MSTVKERESTATIQFETELFKIGSWTILKLPKDASAKLPSRGMTMVEGTIDGDYELQSPLEPDGRGSHWIQFDTAMQKVTGANAGDTVKVKIKSSKDWPEPTIPPDIQKGVEANAQVYKLWQDITPMARWDWLRWIRSTNNPETRKHRIEVACSKLKAGTRRPCCFNRTACTEPAVTKGAMLIEP